MLMPDADAGIGIGIGIGIGALRWLRMPFHRSDL
jgi:hypothetical protein